MEPLLPSVEQGAESGMNDAGTGMGLRPQSSRSRRWKRFGVAASWLGGLLAVAGAVGIWHIDGNDAAHLSHVSLSDLQILVSLVAYLVGFGGVAIALVAAVWCWGRPSVLTATSGVTVFNWRPVTLSWLEVADVRLVRVARLGRHRWVPGVHLMDGTVVPVRFARGVIGARPLDSVQAATVGAETLAPYPDGRRCLGELKLLRDALRLHTGRGVDLSPADAGGTASQDSVDVGRILELPETSSLRWKRARAHRVCAVGLDWVAWKERRGRVPWNVLYAEEVSSVRPWGGGAVVARADGVGVWIGGENLERGAAAALALALGGHRGFAGDIESARQAASPKIIHDFDQVTGNHTFRPVLSEPQPGSWMFALVLASFVIGAIPFMIPWYVRKVRVRLLVGSSGIVAHNIWRTHRIQRNEIASVALSDSRPGCRVSPVVRLRNGSSFRLLALAGDVSEQEAAIKDLRDLLQIDDVTDPIAR